MKSLLCALFLVSPACSVPARAQGGEAPQPQVEKEPELEAGSEPEQATEPEEGPRLDSGLLAGLALRGIGPALMSGRIADLAIDPVHPNTWYVAVGSGGVWKTVNAGTTWKSIFDGQSSYSIGCLTLDPNDPDTLWVGTGEAVGGRHVGYGDGVYRSRDGGASFENLGLKQSEHIAKIAVDPRDSAVVWVAAQGPLWSQGGERGLYVTRDGGATWTCALSAGPWTGVTDVVLDPRDPDVLLAATHQRHRSVAALVNGGPESGIHKSIDGGATWRKVTSGLPDEDMGKIALVHEPKDPDTVYATIELAGRKGGVWASTDGGESWEKRSDYTAGGTGPHYYQEIWADPHREGVLYHANVLLGRSVDGGRTWQSVDNENKHVDNHAVAFHPGDPQFLLVGCDGGLYVSHDFAATWRYVPNLPLTQFYKLDVDYDWPVYHVIGGTQDNSTQYGPARTLNENGITNGDWRVVLGGDGHDNAIDPGNPDVLYGESQQGYIHRIDRRTGERISIRPMPEAGEEDLRFNWDSPILISPHDDARLWFGAKKLFRSDDRGDSWTAVSGDLSRGLDRFTLPLMGRVWSIDAVWDLLAMSEYGNITSVSESPLVEGLVYVGTDDGLIQVSEDGGANWRRVDSLPGLPEMAFVNDVKADRFDPDTVYAAFDDHKRGDFAPYLFASRDRGRTWSAMVGDLPERHLVWRIEQDHVAPNLFFLGTEFGIFTSLDAGEHWIALTGNAPKIPFRDLAVQRRENDLVGASFGRSFWVLDDYAPLRELSQELVEREFWLFDVRTALSYEPDDELGGRRGSQGDQFYSADNPPYGAVFTTYLRDGVQSLAEARKEAEKKVAGEGGDTPYPGWEALEAEDREEPPAVWFEVRDSAGELVRRVAGPTAKGIARTAWDLRLAPMGSADGRGPYALPGEYTVQTYLRQNSLTRALGEPRRFEVVPATEPTLPRVPREQTLAFQREAGELDRVTTAMVGVLDAALAELAAAREVARADARVARELQDEARRVQEALTDARWALVGNPTAENRSGPTRPSVRGRLQSALYGTMGNTHGPTATLRRQLEIARAELTAAHAAARRAVEVDLAALQAKLDAAGAAWSTGRGLPPLPKGR